MTLRSVSILIPLYNEEEFIYELLSRVAAAPLPGMKRDIVVVDDGSRDSSVAMVERFKLENPDVELRLIVHEKNSGKGAAIRTAIHAATGDFSIIQDADLEYDPQDYPKLFKPLLSGEADVVYGSRFLAAGERRVLYFWHSVANQLLTLVCNIASDLNLTDMETCYKAFRTAFVKTIPIDNDRFGIEPELTIKFARRRARIFETSISYHGRTYEEGKKIGLKDAFEALWVIVRARLTDRIYSEPGLDVLDAMAYAPRFNKWLAGVLEPYMGRRILEIGSGSGNITRLLCMRRERYMATESDEALVERLHNAFQHRPTLETAKLSAGTESDYRDFVSQFDTVLCVNSLAQMPDEPAALHLMKTALRPGGRLVLVVPNDPRAFGTIDRSLGNLRRYTPEGLAATLTTAGFQIEKMVRFNRVSWLAWRFTGQIRKSKTLSRTLLGLFDRTVWFWSSIDESLPWPSISLVAVARLPE